MSCPGASLVSWHESGVLLADCVDIVWAGYGTPWPGLDYHKEWSGGVPPAYKKDSNARQIQHCPQHHRHHCRWHHRHHCLVGIIFILMFYLSSCRQHRHKNQHFLRLFLLWYLAIKWNLSGFIFLAQCPPTRILLWAQQSSQSAYIHYELWTQLCIFTAGNCASWQLWGEEVE